MSEALKQIALTAAIGVASIATAFSQNKTKFVVADNLKPSSKFTTEVWQSETDGEIYVSYRGSDNKVSIALDLGAEDIDQNGIIEANEINYIKYTRGFTQNDKLVNAFSAFGGMVRKIPEHGHPLWSMKTNDVWMSADRKTVQPGIENYSNIEDIPYVLGVLPNLKKGLK
jgi:hypothetical protein